MTVADMKARMKGVMTRWEPDAAGRLQAAAIALYAEHGFERTTVAEIAERAGLTERTFFRHFADKREVLFQGSERLRDQLVDAVIRAPASVGALSAVAHALESLSPFFDERRAWSAQRYAVIATSSDLRERELIKRATLAAAVAGALGERGERQATATLAAELGITAFHVAYERWVVDPDERTYAVHVRETLAELRTTCGAEPSARVPAAAPAGDHLR